MCVYVCVGGGSNSMSNDDAIFNLRMSHTIKTTIADFITDNSTH